MPRDIWNEIEAQEQNDLEGLVYRNSLLGQDRCVVDLSGGTTSAKLAAMDHMGRSVDILWIASVANVSSTISDEGFAGLRLAELLALMERNDMSEADLVDYLAHCVHALNRPQAPIETLLHALIPAKHVDHTHPDAVVSLGNATNARDLCQELWGEHAVWIDSAHSGFVLYRAIGERLRAGSRAGQLAVYRHGLVTWGETSRECYERTIQAIRQAEDFVQAHGHDCYALAATRVPPLPLDQRRQVLAKVLPELRGCVSKQRPAVLQVDDSAEALAFVGCEDATAFSRAGAIRAEDGRSATGQPLFLDWAPAGGLSALSTLVTRGVDGYVATQTAYRGPCRQGEESMRDLYPRAILIPGLGMITSGNDIQAAVAVGRLCRQAIRVRGASRALNQHSGLRAQDDRRAEFWPLELTDSGLPPPAGDLAGRIAIVTGGACGIGRATARRLAQDGAHVAIFDINLEGAQRVADEVNGRYGTGRSLALHCDVADESAVAQAYAQVVLAYGGVDIVVSNAGISIMAPIDETTVDMWNRLMDVLARGYFLISREAFRIWKAQKMGGCLIFVSSKNAVFAGKNTAAYSAAKAAELHMARCLAEEGGAWGIRVNSVLPYAVMEGTSLWGGGLREARAASYGIKPEELDEYYRRLTALKVSVYPENVAEAIRFFAGPQASRTTGGILTVDGGVGAYVR